MGSSIVGGHRPDVARSSRLRSHADAANPAAEAHWESEHGRFGQGVFSMAMAMAAMGMGQVTCEVTRND